MADSIIAFLHSVMMVSWFTHKLTFSNQSYCNPMRMCLPLKKKNPYIFVFFRGWRTPYCGLEQSASWMPVSSRKGKSSGKKGPAGSWHNGGHRVKRANQKSRPAHRLLIWHNACLCWISMSDVWFGYFSRTAFPPPLSLTKTPDFHISFSDSFPVLFFFLLVDYFAFR